MRSVKGITSQFFLMTRESSTCALSAASLESFTIRETPNRSSILESLKPLDFKSAFFLSIGASCVPSAWRDLVTFSMTEAWGSSAWCSDPEDEDGASSRCHEGIDFALFSLIAYLVMDGMHFPRPLH